MGAAPLIRFFVWIVIRLRWLFLVGWVAAAIAATVMLPGFGAAEEVSLGGLVPSDAEAVAVERRSLERFRVPLLSRAVVVHRNPRGLTRQEQRAIVARAVRASRQEDALFQTIVLAVPVLNTAGVVPSARERSTTAVTYLYFRPEASLQARDALAHSYLRGIPKREATFAGVTGAAPARLAQWRAIEDALPWVELATVLLIALVVGVTFRSVVAPLVALSAAALAYLVAVGAAGWVGTALGITIPREVEPVMLVLLLGVVTDYAVFFLSGMRRRLAEGRDRLTAAADTSVHYMPIVATTGLIVTCGTAALLVGKLEFFRAFGPGAALAVLVALVVSLTFIPSALAVFGNVLFWPSLERLSLEEVEPSAPSRLAARGLASRPLALLAALAAIAALLVPASQLVGTRLGFTLLTGLPAGSEVERAAFEAGKGFAPGIVAPVEVLVEGDRVGTRREALLRLQEALAAEPGVAGVVGAREVPRGVEARVLVGRDAARFAVIAEHDPLGAAAIENVRALERRLPELLDRAGLAEARAGLAGDTVLAGETVASIVDDIKRIALAALLVNFVFLALFLRAVVAPLFLLAASALGLAAALGATAWAFRELFGYGDLTYYVPFAAAVLLLSLGSDYNLFVVGRVWQEARRRSVGGAIRYAVPRAARAISIAGIALAGSFALLALVPLRPFREFAFVMAVGILVDTFLVRSVLVPALIAIFGERSWWPSRRDGLTVAAPEPAAAEAPARTGGR